MAPVQSTGNACRHHRTGGSLAAEVYELGDDPSSGRRVHTFRETDSGDQRHEALDGGTAEVRAWAGQTIAWLSPPLIGATWMKLNDRSVTA